MSKGKSYKCSVRRGVLGVPRGTIEGLQFCKNGIIRLSPTASLSASSQKAHGGDRRKF